MKTGINFFFFFFQQEIETPFKFPKTDTNEKKKKKNTLLSYLWQNSTGKMTQETDAGGSGVSL